MLSPRAELLLALEEKARRQSWKLFSSLYPDEDRLNADGTVTHARRKYQKHLEFFRAGASFRERCILAANRVGKTLGCGGYELAAHLTGLYPDWWEGRRFKRPIRAWAGGKTNETTRDIVQATMLGEIAHEGQRKVVSGTGLIAGNLLGQPTWKQGVADLVDTIKIKHVTGNHSLLGLKSYQQGRGSFEGTAQHVIWLDEEPPMDIYGECLIRTATVDGLIMLTFTPLEGLSEVVMSFLSEEDRLPDA